MCGLVVAQRIQHQITQQGKIGSFIQFTTVEFGSSSLNKDKSADSWQAVPLQRMCGIQGFHTVSLSLLTTRIKNGIRSLERNWN